VTRIFVDNREIGIPKDNSSMSQILKYVEDSHLAQNSAVWQIQVNGLPLIPNGFSENRDRTALGPMKASDKIEIFTGTLAEIARQAISDALNYVEFIESATPSLARSFRTNPPSESFKELPDLYEGLYWWHLLLDKLKADFLDPSDGAAVWKGSESDYYQKLVSILKRLIESREKENFVRIADLLEREIIPLIPVWRGMLGAVAQRMGVTQQAVKSLSNESDECQTHDNSIADVPLNLRR
jgi:hypothetical protein